MSKARKMLDVEAYDVYVDFDIIDGKSLDSVIEQMASLKQEYPDRDLYFFIQGYGYDGGKELKMYERRLENDKEYEKRMAYEKKERAKKREDKAMKDARDLKEFMRLKKKFDK